MVSSGYFLYKSTPDKFEGSAFVDEDYIVHTMDVDCSSSSAPILQKIYDNYFVRAIQISELDNPLKEKTTLKLTPKCFFSLENCFTRKTR